MRYTLQGGPMKFVKNRVMLLVVAVGISRAAAGAAQNGQPAPPAPAVDPDVTGVLDRVGTYLRSLNTFQIHGKITVEDVLDSGQKVQFGGTVELLAQRPNRLRVELKGDREQRVFLYDGKNFTLYAPRMGYYATAPAPGTIKELLDQIEEKYDIELPLVDLFLWGTEDSDLSALTAATEIGAANIEGTTTQQLAMRQNGLDWQVWVQTGAFPLPRKVVLTTMTDDARPQYTAVYTWNLAPSFGEDTFTFVPPEGTTRIPFAEVKPMSGVEKKK
jgi:hypothetical protein